MEKQVKPYNLSISLSSSQPQLLPRVPDFHLFQLHHANLIALTTVMILYCELAYATPDVVCSSTEQGLCANQEPQDVSPLFWPMHTNCTTPGHKKGKRLGTQYCAGSDSPACCPTGTITWTSANHLLIVLLKALNSDFRNLQGKYIKVVGLTRKKCRVLKRNDGGDHGDM
ncbi:hypothetical protein PSTT_05764 [Puccinia striiformis]|uniref:Uncharacterized protein n=1 Tax=Puccinia striiformis TaxID=27350 RepID=A0A2S4VMK3_9BASI|nr:hypothetical protein PSTT_05764 [Puccinia striiformis]